MSDWLPEEKPVNWVERRADCTGETVLRAIKYQLQLDIDEFKKRIKSGPHTAYKLEASSFNITIEVRNPVYGGDKEALVRVQDGNEISVDITNIDKFSFQFAWNDDEAVCEFFDSDGKPIKRWQISQKILGPILFGDRYG